MFKTGDANMRIHRRKKQIGILLAATLLLGIISGCGENGASGSAVSGQTEDVGAGTGKDAGKDSAGRGRFMESEVTLPEGVSNIMAVEQLVDGSIALFGSDEERMQFLTAKTDDLGENWEVQKITDDSLDTAGYIDSCAMDKDGTAALLITSSNGAGGISSRICYVGADGAVSWQELTWSEEQAPYLWELRFDAAGDLLGQSTVGTIYKIDRGTGTCTPHCDTEGAYSYYFGVAGNLVFVVAGAEGVLCYDAADGSLVEENGALNEILLSDGSLSDGSVEYMSIVFHEGTKEGQTIYANHDGIFSYMQGGSVSEQLVNGALTTLGDTTGAFTAVLMPDEEHFLAAVTDGRGEHKLLKYSYDKDALSMPEKELKVYALNDSAYLRQVISSYQRANQDVYVNLQIGMTGEDGVTAEDALRALNTDILAGNGPDVLILDGMPADSYIEKGMLADLSPLVEELRAGDGVFENIIAPYEQDGKIYQIPARFYLSVIIGEQEAVESGATLSGLCDYAKMLKESGVEKIFGGQSAESLLESLYAADAAKLFDGSGAVDSEALLTWLGTAKQLYDLEEHIEDGAVVSYVGYGISLHDSENAFGILMGECELSMGTLTSLAMLPTMLAAVHEAGVTYGLLDRDAVRSFVPYQKVGIISGTSYMEEAEGFVRTMLGSECGQSTENGFSVNRAAYSAASEAVQELYGDGAGVAVSTDDGISLEVALNPPTNEEMTAFTALLESLDAPSDTDSVIEELIMEQAKSALAGEKSVEDACAEIEKKVSLYLAE